MAKTAPANNDNSVHINNIFSCDSSSICPHVCLSVCLSVGRQQRVSRSVPRLINVKCGSGKVIGV